MMIETKRLILRPVTVVDAEDIFAYSQGANVGPRAGWKPHETIEETREIMQLIFLDQEGVFAMVWRDTQRVIGTIGLIDDPKRENAHARMLGYAMSEQYWGQGLMTEAAKALVAYGFETLGLDVISAYCYPHNVGSKRVLEKCGFAYEGCLRLCEERYDGQVLDNACYALLKN